MDKREMILQQINDLTVKAIQRPMPQDAMGMIGFASTLLAAQMQSLLLQADEREPGSQEVEEEGEQK